MLTFHECHRLQSQGKMEMTMRKVLIFLGGMLLVWSCEETQKKNPLPFRRKPYTP